MPVSIMNIRATVPEPSKDRNAQRKLTAAIHDAADEFEAKIKALGGVSESTLTSKREPGARDLTPPPADIHSEADMVTLAEVGAAVDDAASGRRAA